MPSEATVTSLALLLRTWGGGVYRVAGDGLQLGLLAQVPIAGQVEAYEQSMASPLSVSVSASLVTSVSKPFSDAAADSRKRS